MNHDGDGARNEPRRRFPALDPELPDELMQNIAKENNLAETAFFVKTDDGYKLRWFTPEYEIGEFDLANVANHAEMAWMIAPRPFMVERGHRDTVGVDEWISYEYAKVRRFYDEMGIGERTRIEYFNGPHRINGIGTVEFLKQQLRWP